MDDSPAITVTIPKMLAELVGGGRTIEVRGDTVADTIDGMLRRHPELRVHLFDESRSLRRHVLCFHNDVGVADLDEPVAPGDTVTVLQAVSGGT